MGETGRPALHLGVSHVDSLMAARNRMVSFSPMDAQIAEPRPRRSQLLTDTLMRAELRTE